MKLQNPVRFGPHKIPLEPWGDYDDVQRHRREMLYRALNTRALVAFVGAGCSLPLGYLSWREFGLRMISEGSKVADSKHLATLERLKARVAGPSDATDLVYALSTVQKVFNLTNKQEHYDRILFDLFKQPDLQRPQGQNPYHVLLGLPILRFITSNYDCELEKALVEIRRLPRAEFVLPATVQDGTHTTISVNQISRSFSQRDRKQLSQFALAGIEDINNCVFHCHGYYSDPKSMIVSEQDYREQYLGPPDGTGVGFQQTLALLFGSNPILFVGYGLGDDDLLRPLRMFIASDRTPRNIRPLFALLPLWQKDSISEQQDRFDYLYERYRVNVIGFPCEGSQKTQDPLIFASALCNELVSIKSEWQSWWTDWLKKPAMRALSAPSEDKKTYFHYTLKQPPIILAQNWVVQNRQQLAAAIKAHIWGSQSVGSRGTTQAKSGLVVVVTGVGGTGKSCLVTDLLDELGSDFDDFFFWSSYYTDDSVSGIDRALAFMDSHSRINKKPRRQSIYASATRFRKLLFHLKTGRHVLVFDGAERFLRETDNPGQGEVCSPTIHKFLETICSPESKSVVILTSRLWPVAFDNKEMAADRVLPFSLPRVNSLQLSDGPFNLITARARISEVCMLLDGHIYALALLAGVLSTTAELNHGRDKLSVVNQALDDVTYALSRTPPDRRTSRMIRETVKAIGAYEEFVRRLLEIISLFASPVKEDAFKACWSLAQKTVDNQQAPELGSVEGEALIDKLWKMRLLQRVKESDEELGEAYTMHPMVREYFFRHYHHSGIGAVPNLTLPGFTAAAMSSPLISEENAKTLCSMFGMLRDEASAILKTSVTPNSIEWHRALTLCRNLFGLVRSRMGVLTVQCIQGWPDYNAYARCLAELADITRKISPDSRWRFADAKADHYEHRDGPLYADELAWLYNEIGLVSYAQGSMIDALASWDQAYAINQVIDGAEEGGYYMVQSLCNLGAANIEYGYLRLAEQYLREGLKTSRTLRDSDHEGRMLGYLALIQQLRGNLPEAAACYQSALGLLRHKNPRAEIVFLLHYADLKFKQGKLDSAERDLQKALALAEAERYLDLVAYARQTKGHLLRIQKSYSESLLEYRASLEEAKRIGIRKLEADILSELARLALDLGDGEVARQRAIVSLDIANELGLGLRKTHGLVVLGLATLKVGQREMGVAYLEHARRLADRQEYWLRMREAEEELYRLGELGSIAHV